MAVVAVAAVAAAIVSPDSFIVFLRPLPKKQNEEGKTI
jgi:hypothetical protein